MESRRRRAGDDENSEDYLHRSSRWRLQREISIPTLAFLLAQAATSVWWAATMAGRVDALEKGLLQSQTQQNTVDARQDADAIRAETRIAVQIERLGMKLDRLVEARYAP